MLHIDHPTQHRRWQAGRGGLQHPAGSSCLQGCRWHSGCAKRIWYCDWDGNGCLSVPAFSCTGCHTLTLIKKVEVQIDAIPHAILKFESMQKDMQARHGPGDLVCCRGMAVNLRGSLDGSGKAWTISIQEFYNNWQRTLPNSLLESFLVVGFCFS